VASPFFGGQVAATQGALLADGVFDVHVFSLVMRKPAGKRTKCSRLQKAVASVSGVCEGVIVRSLPSQF
jgi:hypothetical protein